MMQKLRLLLITIAVVWHKSELCGSSTLTENQIIENIKILSRSDIGFQPSRLRALLVNDLRNVLVRSPPEKHDDDSNDDCSAEANVKVDTINCNCSNFACLSRQFSYYTKRSRFLIARNCEDICCRKRVIAKKSASPSSSSSSLSNFDNYSSNRQCEIHNLTNNVNDLRIKSMVQIYSADFRQLICLGSLVHPKVVLTTLECLTMRPNDRLYVKMKETVDVFQNLYQVRNVTEKITDNHMDRIEKLRFNMALLVLDKEIEINSQIGTTCLPTNYESVQNLATRKCFITSLEYVNGRLIERNVNTKILEVEKCRDIFNHQNRLQIFFPKQNICASRYHMNQLSTVKIKSNGASLICIHEENDRSGDKHHYYVLYGLLAWTNNTANERFNSPHLFTNIYNYRFWLEKKLKKII